MTAASPFWTAEEIDFIKVNAATMSSHEIAQHLKRPRASVQVKARQNGIKFYVKRCMDGTTRRRWTRAEVTMLQGLAETCSIEAAAKRMGRSFKSVANKIDEEKISFKKGRIQLKDLAEIFQVSGRCIADRRDKLGLRFRLARHNKKMTGTDMRGPKGSDIVALAEDFLNDPPLKDITPSAPRLREIIEEFRDWE